jgi:hypothetical protein
MSHAVLVVMVARAMAAIATAMLASADGTISDEVAEVLVGDVTDADQAGTKLDEFNEDELEDGLTFAGFTTLSMNAQAAYAAILDLNTTPRGIPMGIGTPTEGTIAGINLGTMGIIVDNPANAPLGSLTVTNATVTSIDNGIATETTVTAPDSVTVTPAGVVSFNTGV